MSGNPLVTLETEKVSMFQQLNDSFVSEHVRKLVFPIQFPLIKTYDNVVVAVLDVSGYTKLTRRLLERNAAGFNAVE